MSARDGELFLDVINLNYANAQSKGSANDEKLLQSNYYDSPFKCLDFQWPYIFYIYQSKFAVIISANHTKTMFSFLVPKDIDDKKCNLTNMYVTEHHEMYIATFSKSRYNIYRVTDSLRTLIHPSFIEDTNK